MAIPKRKPKVRGRPKKGTPDWKPIFLAAVASGSHVSDAVVIAQIHISVAYERRDTDIEFAVAWRKAQKIGTRELKAEARRRAYHGTLKPVYQGKELVGHIREYSDTLLKWLIQVRDPKYRDKVDVHGSLKHDHSGNVGVVL